ncbi:MAG: alpha/beta hydrolase [Leptolyngbyaceae cyanobacterium SM2_3_12]|nr:alpha/beta hydrolase [Leptolyngbyaceae cyanobacterium SM2_3_12]
MQLKTVGYVGLITATLVSLGLAPGIAAEEAVLKYRGFSRTVPVEDLQSLAETGEPPDSVAGLLNQAGRPPADLQSLLTRELLADPVLLDKALNSWPGEWMLDQLGEAIYPSSGTARRQALRSALVLSATGDDQITLLEVLQNYPTPEVVLDGDLIQDAYSRLAVFLAPLSILL